MCRGRAPSGSQRVCEVGLRGSREHNTKGNSETTRRRMKRRSQGPRVGGPVGKKMSQGREGEGRVEGRDSEGEGVEEECPGSLTPAL